MSKRFWVIECPKCKKKKMLSVGNFRIITDIDLEFALKPQFHCLKCDCLCNVELGESK